MNDRKNKGDGMKTLEEIKTTEDVMTVGRKDDNEVIVNEVTVGSKKQIDWANIIKCNLIVTLLGWLDQPGMSVHADRFNAVISGLNEINDAQTLIDNRDMSNKEVIKWIEGKLHFFLFFFLEYR